MKITEITLPTRSLYVIRNKETGQYLKSARTVEQEGLVDFKEAAIYHEKENADKVLRNLERFASGKQQAHYKPWQEYITKLFPLLEVVECVLRPKL